MDVSAQARRVWDLIRSGRVQREGTEELTSEPVGVTYRSEPAVDGLWAASARVCDGAAVLYLFGGGYVSSSPHSRRKFAGHLALASGARVLVPNYRLAPEHPFPAAVDDATLAYEWLLTQEVRADRCVIAGDSSGGGLALATLLNLRERDAPLPAGAVALSPWTDLTCGGASFDTRAAVDLCVTRADLLASAARYLGGADAHLARASPLFADLHDLPPLLVLVGSDETLLDDAVGLVRAAALAGGEATLHVGAGMQHIFPVYAGAMPEADAAVSMIGAWIRAHTAG